MYTSETSVGLVLLQKPQSTDPYTTEKLMSLRMEAAWRRPMRPSALSEHLTELRRLWVPPSLTSWSAPPGSPQAILCLFGDLKWEERSTDPIKSKVRAARRESESSSGGCKDWARCCRGIREWRSSGCHSAPLEWDSDGLWQATSLEFRKSCLMLSVQDASVSQRHEFLIIHVQREDTRTVSDYAACRQQVNCIEDSKWVL